jgi:beta-phosphoglucomutase-like phosphatase (HAD superfamily)
MSFGYLFDLDGTLVDTQLSFHARAESMVLSEFGIDVRPEDISERFSGIKTKLVFEALAPGFDAEMLARRKWEKIFDLIEHQQLRAMPGMFEVCCKLYRHNIPIAIASASPFSWICECLSEPVSSGGEFCRFVQIFGGNFISVDNCKRSKPFPDVFLAARDSLIDAQHDAINRQWIAVGDGESDVLAGLAAGMDVLFLSASNTKFDDNPRVQRFTESQQLADFISQQAIS